MKWQSESRHVINIFCVGKNASSLKKYSQSMCTVLKVYVLCEQGLLAKMERKNMAAFTHIYDQSQNAILSFMSLFLCCIEIHKGNA